MSLATTAFLLVAILQAVAAALANSSTTCFSNIVGSLVCCIAFLHYRWMQADGSNMMAIRYSDWFFTLPLLVLEIFIILGIGVGTNLGYFLVVLTLILVMLGSGWMSVRFLRNSSRQRFNPRRMLWLLLGFVALVAIYWIVLGILEQANDNTLTKITITFFLLWSLYGVVALGETKVIDSGPGQYMYDILDIITKAVFGIIVAFSSFN